MRVIPRSLSGDSEHESVEPDNNVLTWEAKKQRVDESKAITIELQPNHASLHDGRLMHGSPHNTSRIRRCGYTMRYMPTTVKLNEASLAWHNIYLARGRDHAGNQYADPMRRYDGLANARRQGAKLH